jgi:hypothetical protein
MKPVNIRACHIDRQRQDNLLYKPINPLMLKESSVKNPENMTQAQRRVALSLAGLTTNIDGLTLSFLLIPISSLFARIGRNLLILSKSLMRVIGSMVAIDSRYDTGRAAYDVQ